ncbi:hypothetical protein Hanom_Chr11g00996131 [Helianthus anomalus]
MAQSYPRYEYETYHSYTENQHNLEYDKGAKDFDENDNEVEECAKEFEENGNEIEKGVMHFEKYDHDDEEGVDDDEGANE